MLLDIEKLKFYIYLARKKKKISDLYYAFRKNIMNTKKINFNRG